MKRNSVAGPRISFKRFFGTGATSSQGEIPGGAESAVRGASRPSSAASRTFSCFASADCSQSPQSGSRTLPFVSSKGLQRHSRTLLPLIFAVFFLVPSVLAIANTLPDGRQYEMVTPREKNGALIGGLLAGMRSGRRSRKRENV
jgi:hypothetical protein